MNQNNFLDPFFDLLAENKRFPSYQAERRIDIFINFYIKSILEDFIGKEIAFVAPEFPLKKEQGNQSTNVDYLCVQTESENKKILFVELKTDSDSFDIDQLQTYVNYKNSKTWKDCIEDIGIIATSKGMKYNNRKKYFHLIKTLEKYNLLNCDKESINSIDLIIEQEKRTNDVNEKINLKGRFTYQLKKLFAFSDLFKTHEYNIEIIYIAPKAIKDVKEFDNEHVILIALEDIFTRKIIPDYSEVWGKLAEMFSGN